MPGASFDEIGKAIGTTSERARQIYKEALEKMRQHLQENPEQADELFTCLQDGRRNLQCPKIPEENLPE